MEPLTGAWMQRIPSVKHVPHSVIRCVPPGESPVAAHETALHVGALLDRPEERVDAPIPLPVETRSGMTREASAEDFLEVLSHDLRNGMTVPLGAKEILLDQRERLDSVGREALELLAGELDRQQKLLSELLDLARARTQPAQPVLLRCEASRALAQHGSRIPVRLHAGGDVAGAVIHLGWFRRIAANLLDNAERHAGGVTVVRVGRTEGWAWVAVEDAGPGIPAGERERVFTRFLTSAGPACGQGSHLGLAISREHIRRAGGELSVQDAPGSGARFLLQLPHVR